MELFMKAYQGGGDVAPVLSKAEEALKGGLEKLTVPALRNGLEKQIEQHTQQADYVRQAARERAEILGKPSPEWETTDFDGKKHSIRGYLGNVVILDFWYRGCGWCIRAMPQIRQLAEEFKERPVAILGMNTDQEEKDARFVIEAMELNYPNLKAQGLPEKYKVKGFPTLIVIDPQGVVRDVHVGYSPKLRDKVRETIEELLPE